MSDEKPNFYVAVRLLRALGPRHALLAVYAAAYWSDEKLDSDEREGNVPGRPGEFPSKDSPLQ
jgi:hypothetical protein